MLYFQSLGDDSKIVVVVFFADHLDITYIMITCPYNVDPLTLHFYIVKLGFAGVCIIFLFLL